MGQPKKKVSVDQVLNLVEQLSATEKGELRYKMDSAWGDRWDSLVKKVDEQNKDLPAITEDEIYSEFSEHRREQKAKRAQSSS